MGIRARQVAAPVAIGLLAAAFVFALWPKTHKLDEALIYEGPEFRLKLVRYYEHIFLHYDGEVFRVQCASERTKNSPALKTQEAGWVTVGNGGAIGSDSAAELAAVERHKYLVVDDRTLVWMGNGLYVSFDACGVFRGWHPSSLPKDWIDPVDKPDYCRPTGTADCSNYDFMGERTPRFEDIRVTGEGKISFVVRSNALRDGKSVRVESADFGKSWQTSLL